jgi:enamine deaminase RidA (YjgF/YER057c/UK114 family)
MSAKLLPVVLALALAGPAAAQEVTRTYPTPATPIAAAVTVPAGYDAVYLSGALPDPLAPPAQGAAPVYGTTEQQTGSVLRKLAAGLQTLGLTEGDVVKMTVFLAGDPAKGGAMDFAGMMTAYRRHYGTPTQPNRPARSTVQVAALVAPGALVEIEVVAARRPKSPGRE